jgi:hypothetical protein
MNEIYFKEKPPECLKNNMKKDYEINFTLIYCENTGRAHGKN